MIPRHARAALLPAALLVGACVYYNGLYNADHLAADAARAIREGRPGEARALWEQAAIKAESVAVRHPRSRYRDQALVLQGEALRAAGACGRAIAPLSLVADSSHRAEYRFRAALSLGACYVEIGEPEPAGRALTPLVEGADAPTRLAARLWRARASIAAGRAEAALGDLESLTTVDAAFARAHALAMLGRNEDAAAALQTSTEEFDEARWHGALDLLGRARPDLASELTERALADPTATSGAKARLLLADADRWATARELAGEERRLEQALALAPDSVPGRVAAARLAVARLRSVGARAEVAPITAQLSRAVEDGGQPARIAEPALAVLRRMTVARELASPDLRLFLAAEAVRDALQAPRLAEALFVEIARDHPRSPLAPKALLAAAALGSASQDSLLAIVETTYAASPYWIAARGGAVDYPPEEDLLRALSAQDAAEDLIRPRVEEIRRPPTPTPPRGRTPEP